MFLVKAANRIWVTPRQLEGRSIRKKDVELMIDRTESGMRFAHGPVSAPQRSGRKFARLPERKKTPSAETVVVSR